VDVESVGEIDNFLAKIVVFLFLYADILHMVLDDFDHHILRVMQADNQKTHGQIGEIVGLSASAVRRRLLELRKSKAIVADVSVIASELRGLTFITQVKLKGASASSDAQFLSFVRKDTAVSQCYSVSGDFDYVLIVHAKDPQSYEDWGKQTLLAAKNVASYTSTLVWSRIKNGELS